MPRIAPWPAECKARTLSIVLCGPQEKRHNNFQKKLGFFLPQNNFSITITDYFLKAVDESKSCFEMALEKDVSRAEAMIIEGWPCLIKNLSEASRLLSSVTAKSEPDYQALTRMKNTVQELIQNQGVRNSFLTFVYSNFLSLFNWFGAVCGLVNRTTDLGPCDPSLIPLGEKKENKRKESGVGPY